MKKLGFALFLLIIATTVLSANVWATGVSDGWGLSLNVEFDSAVPENPYMVTKTMTPGLYLLSWSGSRTLTMPGGNYGTLYGSIDPTLNIQDISSNPIASAENEYLYKFYYRSGGTWYEIGQLFNDTYSYNNPATANTLSLTDGSPTFTAQVLCDGIGIQYGAYYYGNGGSASGTLGMSATAVPEASTLVGLGTGVALNAGAFLGFFRRRKL